MTSLFGIEQSMHLTCTLVISILCRQFFLNINYNIISLIITEKCFIIYFKLEYKDKSLNLKTDSEGWSYSILLKKKISGTMTTLLVIIHYALYKKRYLVFLCA